MGASSTKASKGGGGGGGAAQSSPAPVPASGAIVLGCIDYCDSIRSIWDGIKQYFIKSGVDFDFVLFTNYDRQVEALLAGYLDIAWNGPLAHVRTQKRTGGKSLSLGMRDVDCGFVTHIIVRKTAGITDLAGLQGKRLAAGTRDSPQACILPMHFLKKAGVPLDSLDVTFFDKDYGKHGDTALGEVDVMDGLTKGEYDAGLVSDLMWMRALSSGDVNGWRGEGLEILEAAKVPRFNHCQFDALPTLDKKKLDGFRATIFQMDKKDPEAARLMDLEGIKDHWEQPEEEGYKTMREALEHEPNVPFPPSLYTEANRPFKSFRVL